MNDEVASSGPRRDWPSADDLLLAIELSSVLILRLLLFLVNLINLLGLLLIYG